MKTMQTLLERKSFVKYKPSLKRAYIPYTPINFSEVDKCAKHMADIIESRFIDLTHILLKYESYEVVQDEVNRTLDLLKNLKENKKFFCLRVGSITSFLPRNQPLYAFTCFVLIPSLMASEVHFRIPHSMWDFFPDMLSLLEISKLFTNIVVSSKQRVEFIKERSALAINPKTKETRPVTDVVIFTGLPSNADKLRIIFDKRTLFIANGTGHNPVVVSNDADLSKAVEAVTTLQFYNQGQDCAAPNAILVHKSVLSNFLTILRENIRTVKIGHYTDKLCRIGPISDSGDLITIQGCLVKNREWLDFSTPGIIRTHDSIVEPTIICKPLMNGGNFNEIFAPIIFVQEYTNDSELALYFEDSSYALNAMYITLYGTSNYVKNLIGRSFSGKVIHNKFSFLHNIHLHMKGVERGTQPYGGLGYGASNVSINGKIMPMATLPQRDIYRWIVSPLLRKKSYKHINMNLKDFIEIEVKDVEKILRLRHLNKALLDETGIMIKNTYLDTCGIKDKDLRYIKIKKDYVYNLLEKPNSKYIISLKKDDIKLIHSLKKILYKKSKVSLDEFKTLLYAIPKDSNATKIQNLEHQRFFFQTIYQLLFGKKIGPRLATFLWEMDEIEIVGLLDV